MTRAQAGRLRAVIFDLDGVLTDTAEFHYRGWQRLADEEGWPFDRAVNERLRGVSRMESLAIILESLPERGAPEEQRLAWADRKNRYYRELLRDITPDDLLPGALDVVLRCKERGLAVAIGSSSRNAGTVLDQLGITALFDTVADGHSVARAKPAPDLFLHAAEALGAPPVGCAVLEDAASGVDAALAAGMLAVGIGPAERVGHAHVRFDEVADVDVDAFAPLEEQHLRRGVTVRGGWTVAERAPDPERLLVTGSAFLVGNGYLGYRGTFPEHDAGERVACIVSGTYDRADGRLTELCNAPNALRATWHAPDPVTLRADTLDTVVAYDRELGVRYGVLRRRWAARGAEGVRLRLDDERFASYEDVHLLCQRVALRPDEALTAVLECAVDGTVWSPHGEHLATCDPGEDGDELVMVSTTVESGLVLAVAQAVRVRGADVRERRDRGARLARRLIEAPLEAGQRVQAEVYMAVYSTADVADPRRAALDSVRAAAAVGYDRAKAAHALVWDRRWRDLDVEVDGDPVAQALVRYNLYQAVIATPAHAEHLPVPARGLSCQAHQGGASWDQEAFLLPMWLETDPAQARRILAYRHRTLPGARRKAAARGYRGAFYAWVSGPTGDELGPDVVFTDVLTGRPLRTHLNDWQIHGSPGVVHALDRYLHGTGDWDFVVERGAEIAFEVARFCASRVHLRPDRDRYRVLRVIGPDEHHENVDDDAFTNHMMRHALDRAVAWYERMAASDPDALDALRDRIQLDATEVDGWRDVRDRLHLPAPDPVTGLVEQFTGYLSLEDTTPAALEQRLLDPGEHWGWPAGVAVSTQVLKQPDVLQLAVMLPDALPGSALAANYDHYAPRTQPGSALSPSTHAIVAARLGRDRDAYRAFLASAAIDLQARECRVSGGTFLGGIQTAACGAVWLIVTRAFAGLRLHDDGLGLDPRLPAGWRRLAFPLVWRGRRVRVEVTPAAVRVEAAADNAGVVPLQVGGRSATVPAGARVEIAVPAAPTG